MHCQPGNWKIMDNFIKWGNVKNGGEDYIDTALGGKK
jgi:hypothetical protein